MGGKRAHIGRLILALLSAPIIGVALATFAAVAIQLPGSSTNIRLYLPNMLIFSLAFIFFAALALWTFGLAWHVFAMRRGMRAAPPYILAGGAIGGAFVPASPFIFGRYFSTGSDLLLGVAIGALVALVFWLIRRPDRDAQGYADKPRLSPQSEER